MSRQRRVVAGVAAALLLCAAVAAGVFAITRPASSDDASRATQTPGTTESPSTAPSSSPGGGTEDQPNIVYILADDLSMNLVPYMKNVDEMMSEGYDFTNFFTPNSQCCPSRAAIFTGQYGHNNGVMGNTYPDGGIDQYLLHGDDKQSLAVYMHDAGYHTAFMGKYLNGYEVQGKEAKEGRPGQVAGSIPPGWDSWFGIGGGYTEFNYSAATSDKLPATDIQRFGDAESDYGVDVLAKRATEFIGDAAAQPADDPFLLYVASFSPHHAGKDFPAAPRDRPVDDPRLKPSWARPEFADGDCGPVQCSTVQNGRTVSSAAVPEFNKLPTDAPGWMPTKGLDRKELTDDQAYFVQRVQMVQSLDDLVGEVWSTLKSTGLADNTYLVFTSDNGFHLGEHGLVFGKQTAFDSDTHVPFVVVPPGGLATGRSVDAFVSNVDLVPTFTDLAGAPSTKAGTTWDGASFAWAFEPGAREPDGWANGALLEHLEKEKSVGQDPDEDDGISPYTYSAVRTNDYLAVRYYQRDGSPMNGQGEFYDLATDPSELNNVWQRLPAGDRATLVAYLDNTGKCVGTACRTALNAPPTVESGGTGARASPRG